MQMAATMMGRCLEYNVLVEGESGKRFPNGSWNGLLGLLYKNEFDMTLPMQLSEERMESFEVSKYLFIEQHSAGYSRPAVTSDIAGFIKPFTPWVMTGLWLLLSLILATVYRGNLKAMLILPSVSLPFNTLEELASSGLPVWVPLNSMLHLAAYHAEANSSLGRFNRSIYNADQPNNITSGIIDYFGGKHVMAAPRSAMLQVTHAYYSKSGICTNFIMKETFLSPNIGVFFFAKGSPIKAKLDFILQGLREFGILDYLYTKALSNATECLKPIKVKSGRALDVGDFYGVFSIYAGGVLVAGVSFVLEMVVFKPPLSSSPSP
ncbi:hypothetical protein Pmani_014672 [Petrolisthes manimaculis]|uniref:Ionotropic glutamate receptor C-terminal domain-containing protein n=1 Tax=Petrolisthes manimaculis TaxID=1843537 RepID=A0AAE1PV95_9EUCA|nr:hypothetical protein Pmani_014672 [Petrolisthes manimaculis]